MFVNNEEGGATAGLIKPNSQIFSTLKYFYTFAFFLKDTKLYNIDGRLRVKVRTTKVQHQKRQNLLYFDA